MEDEMEKLWLPFKLSEEEQSDLQITNNDYGILNKKPLTKRSFNKAVFKSTMKLDWNSLSTIVQDLADNLFLIQFTNMLYKRKVLERMPWSFDNHLVLLMEYDGNIQASKVQISRCPFWIQVYSLPLNRKFLRIKVELDVSKALIRSMNVKGMDVRLSSHDFSNRRLSQFGNWLRANGEKFKKGPLIHKTNPGVSNVDKTIGVESISPAMTSSSPLEKVVNEPLIEGMIRITPRNLSDFKGQDSGVNTKLIGGQLGIQLVSLDDTPMDISVGKIQTEAVREEDALLDFNNNDIAASLNICTKSIYGKVMAIKMEIKDMWKNQVLANLSFDSTFFWDQVDGLSRELYTIEITLKIANNFDKSEVVEIKEIIGEEMVFVSLPTVRYVDHHGSYLDDLNLRNFKVKSKDIVQAVRQPVEVESSIMSQNLLSQPNKRLDPNELVPTIRLDVATVEPFLTDQNLFPKPAKDDMKLIEVGLDLDGVSNFNLGLTQPIDVNIIKAKNAKEGKGKKASSLNPTGSLNLNQTKPSMQCSKKLKRRKKGKWVIGASTLTKEENWEI
ncbi:unnamed protein product [Ilex paraguariensis]|uniref:DUF4283 domain-containing protein n=1 Tax=Ilex paraguariensis TaxID=185542 RepID=A0ABC8RS34_9AQUA